ncbi:MAG TPA: transporter substrate-binding domain-containing protein [Candidatus Competibacteraceae bacterium]|nr:transporter substrate-binding domain-containing protein [Candidatus Competibacteraceae bacterium]HRZ06822.1 transporter substrate-binding domain-containing protein [Candidatus Competibacteraceae bacterium]HSA47444.1 transporter substrate-binding domain-containing protein [Candidatus Competibacteraceae bacterium]
MHQARGWGLVCLLALTSILASGEARADRLDLIHKRGTLIVGVKADYPPLGMRDANGQLVGFEPDLAAELARRLSVGLQLTAVTSANRLQKLEEGAIDMVIATLGDTPQRRRIATLIEPHYYASGVTVLAPADTRLSRWTDLRGRKVCATQGAYFNREMAERYLLDLQIFNGIRDARLALRDGRCIAWLYDDTALVSLRLDPEWANYRTPLPSTLVSPWAIAIAAAESGSRLEHAIADVVADAHRSGWLIAAEQRWNLPPSSFLAEAHQRWTRIGTDGQPVCARLASGEWPAECRDASRLTSTEVSGLRHFGLLIRERTGFDLTFVYDAYDRGQFLTGLWLTVQLLVACTLGSLLVGCLGALTAESGIPLLGGWVRATAAIGRMTPPLLLIYLVFFGLGHLIVTRFGWPVDGFLVATACLSLYAGCSTVFALLDASVVLKGRQPDFALRWKTLPQALRLAYTPVVAILVNVVKATGMASVIAVPELISASTAIVAEHGNTGVMMNVLMITYFLLVLLVVRLFAALERRVLQRDVH